MPTRGNLSYTVTLYNAAATSLSKLTKARSKGTSSAVMPLLVYRTQEAIMVDVWEQLENDETGDPIRIGIDPDGIRVYLSRSVWRDHILLQHPEMDDFKDLIIQAIATPDEREIEDLERRIIRCYAQVPPERQPTKSTLRVRVVVKYVEPP
jgi:hypothetical protein